MIKAAVVMCVGIMLIGISRAPAEDRVSGYGQIKFRAHGPEWWYNRAAQRYDQVTKLRTRLGDRTRALKRARAVTLTRPDALTALRIASIVYHVSFNDLYRRASCESTGSLPASPPSNSTLYEKAQNRTSSAAGLLQFLDSTWDSTPFADYDVYNGYINALAGAWMITVGRGGEWVCR